MTCKLFQKIGIVGSGRMGESIFYYLNEFEYSLVWVFRKPDLRDKAIEKYNKKLRRMNKTGTLNDEIYNYKKENTIVTTDMGDLKNCDLIIETVVEDAEIKSDLFRGLDRSVNKDCIFVSNSSSINPGRICPDSDRRDKFAGLHFFYPVQFNTIVEIISTDVCSPHTIESLKKFTEITGKQAIVLPEKGSFILNKAFIYFQIQSFRFCKENILSFKEIDALIRKHIFTMGTFEFMDQVGLDVILFATENYINDMEYKEFFPVLIDEVKKRVDEGNLGVKSGKGFYNYNRNESEDDPFNLKQISDEERKKYEEDVVNKLICIYINSAYDFVDKGYCTEAEIETALSGYNGMEKGPVTLGHEVGYDKIYNLLTYYYNQTGEEIYNPSASLKKYIDLGKE